MKLKGHTDNVRALLLDPSGRWGAICTFLAFYTSSMMFRHGSISGDILERIETWDSVGRDWLQTLFVRVIRLYDTVSHSPLYSNEACLDLFLIKLCQY